MSWPVWPEALDRFEREGWQAQPQEARLQRSADAGPPSWRPRFSSGARFVSLSIVLTRDERAVFDRFYAQDCKAGSSLFWMPDPSTDGWSLLATDGAPLLASEGLPLLIAARWLCSFGEQLPAETIVEQVKFRKTFNVVVMP